MCAKYRTKSQKEKDRIKLEKLKSEAALVNQKLKQSRIIKWISLLKYGTIILLVPLIIYVLSNFWQNEESYYLKIFDLPQSMIDQGYSKDKIYEDFLNSCNDIYKSDTLNTKFEIEKNIKTVKLEFLNSSAYFEDLIIPLRKLLNYKFNTVELHFTKNGNGNSDALLLKTKIINPDRKINLTTDKEMILDNSSYDELIEYASLSLLINSTPVKVASYYNQNNNMKDLLYLKKISNEINLNLDEIARLNMYILLNKFKKNDFHEVLKDCIFFKENQNEITDKNIKNRILMAEIFSLILTGNNDAAINNLKTNINLSNDNLAKYLTAMCYSIDGELDKSNEVCKNMLENRNDFFIPVTLLMCDNLLAEGKMIESIKILNNIAETSIDTNFKNIVYSHEKLFGLGIIENDDQEFLRKLITQEELMSSFCNPESKILDEISGIKGISDYIKKFNNPILVDLYPKSRMFLTMNILNNIDNKAMVIAVNKLKRYLSHHQNDDFIKNIYYGATGDLNGMVNLYKKYPNGGNIALDIFLFKSGYYDGFNSVFETLEEQHKAINELFTKHNKGRDRDIIMIYGEFLTDSGFFIKSDSILNDLELKFKKIHTVDTRLQYTKAYNYEVWGDDLFFKKNDANNAKLKYIEAAKILPESDEILYKIALIEYRNQNFILAFDYLNNADRVKDYSGKSYLVDNLIGALKDSNISINDLTYIYKTHLSDFSKYSIENQLNILIIGGVLEEISSNITIDRNEVQNLLSKNGYTKFNSLNDYDHLVKKIIADRLDSVNK